MFWAEEHREAGSSTIACISHRGRLSIRVLLIPSSKASRDLAPRRKLGCRVMGLAQEWKWGAGHKSGCHPLQELLTRCLCLCLPVAVTQGLRCHLCKGFGGCSRKFSCPRRSTHCVIIATRECGGRGGLDTPFLHRELVYWAGRAQSRCGAHQIKNRVGRDQAESLSVCGGGVTLCTIVDVTEVWAA